ncbi:MAG TPA: hypothetical protein VIK29_06010, partial [Paludibacter sp.]
MFYSLMNSNKLKRFIFFLLMIVSPGFVNQIFAQSVKSKLLAKSDNNHYFEVEVAKLIGTTSKASDSKASGGYVVCLTKSGEGVKFSDIPASSKLAIRYASVSVGTISIAVNNQPAHKVNIHSSGALTGSFLYSIIDIAIPNHGTLTISLADNDVAVNIDKIIVGKGNLGLPP